MTSRRKVLIGAGAIVAGGGAALGSGAFDQTTAERGLEVTVIAEDDIAAELVDIHVTPADHDQFTIDGEPTGLFPEDGVTYQGVDDPTENDVSLVENDVTLQFGPYLSSSSTEYSDFFRIINAEGGEEEELADNYDVTFSVDEDSENSFEFSGDVNNIAPGNDASIDFTVNAEETDTDGVLTITIEAA